MNNAPKYVPPLRLPALYIFGLQSEPVEIIAASLITSSMLWPEAKEERQRTMYMTLCMRKVHDLLLEMDKEQGNVIFSRLVERYFGGWSHYSQNLVSVQLHSQGKGSLPERSWQGSVAGMLFMHALRANISLNEAAKDIAKEMLNPDRAEDLDGLLKPSADNIMKNYWPRFQHIAHFWAARRFFVLPEPTDSIIRLDKATVSPELDPRIPHGWRGIMYMAEALLDMSAEKKRYKTHKSLLDQEKAFRVIFV
jgi:hypothetical protein